MIFLPLLCPIGVWVTFLDTVLIGFPHPQDRLQSTALIQGSPILDSGFALRPTRAPVTMDSCFTEGALAHLYHTVPFLPEEILLLLCLKDTCPVPGGQLVCHLLEGVLPAPSSPHTTSPRSKHTGVTALRCGSALGFPTCILYWKAACALGW